MHVQVYRALVLDTNTCYLLLMLTNYHIHAYTSRALVLDTNTCYLLLSTASNNHDSGYASILRPHTCVKYKTSYSAVSSNLAMGRIPCNIDRHGERAGRQ